jgi:hypothetical protein
MALEFQAFIDGSARPPDGDFVLTGHIATAEAWAHWRRLTLKIDFTFSAGNDRQSTRI